MAGVKATRTCTKASAAEDADVSTSVRLVLAPRYQEDICREEDHFIEDSQQQRCDWNYIVEEIR